MNPIDIQDYINFSFTNIILQSFEVQDIVNLSQCITHPSIDLTAQ
jgi:hypothetical protein